MKVLLDANVIIAAFITQGLCRAVFELCLNQHSIILSEDLLEEIAEALHKKMKVPTEEVREGLLFLRRNTTIEQPRELKTQVCRDPNDVKVLSLGITAGVDMLVTGDKDLLSLGEFESIPIISPRNFWERLQKRKGK